MKRRSLFLAIAMAVLVGGFGALEARAGFVPLPTTLDKLLPAGSFTTVAAPNETDTFSSFSYSSSPVGSAPAAADVTVKAFNAGLEAGLTFSGAFFAAAGTVVDYSIGYTVTAPVGHFLTDATLSGVFSTFSGTGSGSIGETLLNAANGQVVGTLEVSKPGVASDTILLPPGISSIIVQKDLILVGGSNGASISIFNQGYSSSGTVPEPASFALLGIGMTGFLFVRRFFKKTSVA
jgi:PEP-CTERM motif-containing protein